MFRGCYAPRTVTGGPDASVEDVSGQQVGATANRVQGYGDMASFGRRLGAFCLDAVLSNLVALFLLHWLDRGSAVYLVFTVEKLLGTWLIGQSMGQRILGVRVTPVDGRPMTFLRALARTVLMLLLIPVFFVGADGRGLHDRVARTAVLRLP